ncbi:putative glycine zipper domain-containing protein [Helianthus anomalus]
MREACCSIVSTVVFRLLFVFFIFEFGVVGATLGAIAGAVIGWSNKRDLLKGIIIGAVSGTALSYKLIKAISNYFHSDDADEPVFIVHLVKLIVGDLKKIHNYDEHKIKGFYKVTTFYPYRSYRIVNLCLFDPFDMNTSLRNSFIHMVILTCLLIKPVWVHHFGWPNMWFNK